MTRRGRILLKAGVWAACLAPLAALGHRLATDPLVADPIDLATDTLGRWTLRLLLASLAMTPLRILAGWSWPVTLRRLLGLFAAFYAGLHFSVWVVVDHFFDWPTLWADIQERPFVTAGMSALLLLLPLAATSTAGMVRRLGGRAWRRLHRLVYAAAVLAVLHFLWLAKVGVLDPYRYAAVLAFLLGVRAWDAGRRAWRLRAAGPGPPGRPPAPGPAGPPPGPAAGPPARAASRPLSPAGRLPMLDASPAAGAGGPPETGQGRGR
jgi:sulfoxide reductase heme-binding subunit YedZ